MPTLWAMQLTTNGDCDLFESKFLSPTEFTSDERFKIFDIVVNFLHIIASFLILIVLNAIIVDKLREYHRAARRQSALISPHLLSEDRSIFSAREEERRERQRLRIAIKTTVVIISTYLACNSLHFCLFIIEQFDPTWLLDETGDNFNWIYVMLGDFVSILFVVSSTIRLFIYYKYNAEIRGQIESIGCLRSRKKLGKKNMMTMEE
uniref:G-protein coupled receptors family 1 profile domain-containing protein n=1 Tax=Parascaris univalens TaxID=6257 RepID=A0A915BR89_PARUN